MTVRFVRNVFLFALLISVLLISSGRSFRVLFLFYYFPLVYVIVYLWRAAKNENYFRCNIGVVLSLRGIRSLYLTKRQHNEENRQWNCFASNA